MIYRFIASEAANYPTVILCQLLGVSRSGYYAWKERPEWQDQLATKVIEDARFVRFRNDDGTYVYYATFTAYDGRVVMPELVETSDFLRFRFITLNGPAAENKGMAVFPRKINGLYAMLSRQDNDSIHIMFSDNIHFWNERKMALRPTFPWELIQIRRIIEQRDNSKKKSGCPIAGSLANASPAIWRLGDGGQQHH